MQSGFPGGSSAGPHRPSNGAPSGPLVATAGVLSVTHLPEDAYALSLADAAEAEDAEIVGYIDIDLVNRAPGDAGETPLDNLYVDLIRARAIADVALLPCGMFTSPLPAGPIRRHHLAHITSRERVARVRLTGRELRRVLDSAPARRTGCCLPPVRGWSTTPAGRRANASVRLKSVIHPPRWIRIVSTWSPAPNT